MAVDLSVFERQKSVLDQQQLQDAFDLKKALLAGQTYKNYSGGSLPAALQIANAFAKARDAGDVNRMNDIAVAAKSFDKGVAVDAQGGFVPQSGYGESVGNIEQGKQMGKNTADLALKPAIAGAEANARNTSELSFAKPIAAQKGIGKSIGEAQGAKEVKGIQAPNTISLLERIDAKDESGTSLLDRANGSVLGASATGVRKFLTADSTPASEANAALEIIGNTLTSSIPRMEGPQSNADVAMYKSQAGKIADPNVPAGEKRSAAKEMMRLNQKYMEQSTQPVALSTDKPTLPEGAKQLGTQNGKPIYQMPDGRMWTP